MRRYTTHTLPMTIKQGARKIHKTGADVTAVYDSESGKTVKAYLT